MATLIAVPIFIVLMIVQGGVVSAAPLLRGTADLILLTMLAWAIQERVETAWQWGVIGGLAVSLVSGMPFGVLLAAYLAAVGLALALRRRVWKAPMLLMLATTFLGTLVVHGASFLARLVGGARLPLLVTFELITLPSLFLNLLLAFPVFLVVSDLADWLYPEEIAA